MKFSHAVAALAMAIPTIAVLNCGGYCECLHEDGSHCCVDTTYGAEGNGGTATKSGEDCAARCSTRQVYTRTGKEYCGSSKWDCVNSLSGQFRKICVPEWVHGHGGKKAEAQAKPMGQAWPQVE